MKRDIFEDATQMGRAAAQLAGDALRSAIESRGTARLIVATGASQFTVLENLIKQDVDWSRVEGFHLDEYIGIGADHPASFCGYLKQRFVDHVPLKSFHYLDGLKPPADVCREAGAAVAAQPVDVALVGIGENAHLAFNDPPADFQSTEPYLIVQLDEACRRQQVGEGWFAGLEDVPQQAISMSIQQILKTRWIICSVPDQRKAEAVRKTVTGPVTPEVPASILQQHDDVHLLLDQAAASRLG